MGDVPLCVQLCGAHGKFEITMGAVWMKRQRVRWAEVSSAGSVRGDTYVFCSSTAVQEIGGGRGGFRATSLGRNRRSVGPYSRPMPRALWWCQGRLLFLMSEVPM